MDFRNKGVSNGRAKLTWEAVDEIRAQSAKGVSGRSLANQFDVSTPTISLIVNNKTWVRDALNPKPSAHRTIEAKDSSAMASIADILQAFDEEE